MRLFWISLLMLVLTTLMVLFYRTYGLQGQTYSPTQPMVQIDQTAAVSRLQVGLQFKTISHPPAAEQNSDSDFEQFRAFLQQSYPRVFSQLPWQVIGEHSVLIKWAGTDASQQAAMLIAHQDVVPVGDEASWTHPPFSGALVDGSVWGRGALDDKSSVLAILEALELALANGIEPTRTLYFGFGHDEELGGRQGAAKIADYLKQQGVQLEFVLDEGGVIAQPDMLPGLLEPIALVGVAEKGYLSLSLTAKADGGHSSSPAPVTAISQLQDAMNKLADAPFAQRLDYLEGTFGLASQKMAMPEKLIFSNLWFFGPLIKPMLAEMKSANAMTRTTMVPTILRAGAKDNVIPREANVVYNLRLLPGDDKDNIIAHVRDVIDNPQISIEALTYNPPSPAGRADTPSFSLLKDSIQQSWQQGQLLVAPYLMYAGTDLTNYYGVSDNQYRFLFVPLNSEELGTMHNINERIDAEDYIGMINFYFQFIRNAAQGSNYAGQ